jgi:hypothetical protein
MAGNYGMAQIVPMIVQIQPIQVQQQYNNIQPTQVQYANIQHTHVQQYQRTEYSTSDIVQSSLHALNTTIKVNSMQIPSNNVQIHNNQNVNNNNNQPNINNQQHIKHVFLDETIVHTGQSTILSHLIRLLKQYYDKIVLQNGTNGQKKIGIDIDLVKLAADLELLNQRLMKTVMEIIRDYSIANPVAVKVMGRKTNIPYDGHYDLPNKLATFDLRNFPDNLIIILVEFIRQHNNNTKE